VDGLEWARSKWGRAARTYLRAMESVASRTGTRLIADAEAIARRFRQHYPRGAPCSFIAYGADPVLPGQAAPGLLAPWGLVPGRYHVVVARPEPENHLLEIIEGHRLHLAQQGTAWPLVIVGDVTGATPYQRRLLALACDEVRFTGGVYVPAQLNALRVFAASYLHGHSVGGTNPSLLESLACGNWVIAHDNAFNREVARDVADYFATPAELAQRLNQRMAQSPEAVARRSERARQIVADHYTWPAIVQAYEALMLAEMAQSRQARSRAQP
jgi:glycosyltransferase involved in cell wall biosynthesis